VLMITVLMITCRAGVLIYRRHAGQ
jgi:hypothetical protein